VWRRLNDVDEDPIRVVTEDSDPSTSRLPSRGWALLAAIVAVASFAVIWISASGDARTAAPVSIATTTEALDPTNASTVTSTAPPTTTTDPAASLGPSTSAPQVSTNITVELLEGAAALEGDVALAPAVSTAADGRLWVLRAGGSVVHRNDVPLLSGRVPFPPGITKLAPLKRSGGPLRSASMA